MVPRSFSDVVPVADANRFDMIVHIGNLSDSSMVACPIAPNARFVCAAPDYLPVTRHRASRRSWPRTIAPCCAKTSKT